MRAVVGAASCSCSRGRSLSQQAGITRGRLVRFRSVLPRGCTSTMPLYGETVNRASVSVSAVHQTPTPLTQPLLVPANECALLR